MDQIKLIVGLRNPGSAYEHTRHNVGEWFLRGLMAQYKGQFRLDKKLQAEIGQLDIAKVTCKTMLPLTFMNHSGMPCQLVAQFYKITAPEILVVHDDLDLEAGRIKLKNDGGHGGHNGLKSLIQHLGRSDFKRLRIGIGHPGHKYLVLDYVLGKPSPSDKAKMIAAIERGLLVMPTLLQESMSKAMTQLNGS